MRTQQISDYATRRFALLKDVEHLRRDVYVDTQGIPSIGIGFNLQAHTDLLLQALGYDLTGNRIQQLAAQQATNETDPLLRQAILARGQQAVQDELDYVRQIRSVITVRYSANATSDLNNALMPIMQARADNTNYPSGFAHPSAFAFQSDTDVQAVFDTLMTGYTKSDGKHEEGYEEKVDRWLSANGITTLPATRDSLGVCRTCLGKR